MNIPGSGGSGVATAVRAAVAFLHRAADLASPLPAAGAAGAVAVTVWEVAWARTAAQVRAVCPGGGPDPTAAG